MIDKVDVAIANGTVLPKNDNARENICIPYLMHKEMGLPISECKKAYDIAVDYLRHLGKVKG